MDKFYSRRSRAFTLLLALGLLISALSLPALADGFTDAEDILPAYREAVDEMAVRGVLNGYTDGGFHPQDTLTREQGAKIITYLCIGKEKAEELSCTKAVFDDVPADLWSAASIEWCAQREILLGYGDGRFGPKDTLTGDQFAKMLLCALALSREGNYVGLDSGWYVSVREDARTSGLYAGDADMESDRPISRQQAALLAWNAINAAEPQNENETAMMPEVDDKPEQEVKPTGDGTIQLPGLP